MPTRENTNFPRLSDPDEFESMIRDICALEWNDPHTEKFGRRGQKQYGVDIYGQPADLSGKYRGAQCKLRTKDDQLTKSEIEAEVADACSFPHELETLIIITDAPRDTTVQILIDDISSREAAPGGFRVAIWFWDNITERLAAHPKLIVRYYRDYFANLTVLRAAERLVDVPLQVIYSTTGSSAGTPLLKEALQMRGVRPLSPADSTVQASHLVEVGPDGVVCEYAEQTAGPIGSSLSTLAGEALSLSRQVESSTPIFVVLPRQVQTAFSESFEKLGGDIHRLEILSDNLSLDQRAERVLRAVFDLGHARRGGLSTIDIAVRTRENRPSSALLDVDWQARLSPEHFPAPSEWKDFFVPALTALKNRLLSQSDRARLQFNCQLPIPAAVALGYFFNVRTARIGVWARRTGVSDFKQQFWLSDGTPVDVQYPLTWIRQPVSDGQSAIVEMTTYVSIHKAVEQFADRSGLHPDAWVQINLEVNGTSLADIDEGHAVAYAHQVGQVIRLLNSNGITEIHLFARIPSALGVLVGQRLQACGRLHLYWFDNPTYRFAFTLS